MAVVLCYMSSTTVITTSRAGEGTEGGEKEGGGLYDGIALGEGTGQWRKK